MNLFPKWLVATSFAGTLFVGLVTILIAGEGEDRPEVVDLAGVWRFAMDRKDVGAAERWPG